MKKSYLMIAGAALILTACGDKAMVQDLYSEPAEISFETFTEKQTKAENSGETGTSVLSGHHTTFKVWAAKDANTHQAVYAASTPGIVSYSNSKWTATPVKFWDRTATQYFFYAAAPSDKSWAFEFEDDDDMSDGTITLADYTLAGNNVRTAASGTATASWLGNTGSDRDLMIASPCVVLREKYNLASPEKVTLQFNHILSRLNVLVKKHTNIADCKVSLKELKVYNMLNKGSFNEKPANLTAEQLAGGTIARWATPTSDGNTYTPTAITLTATSASDGVTTSPQYVLETLIIPQNIAFESIDESGTGDHNQAYLRIKYSIDEEEFYGYYNLAKAFGSSSAAIAFNEGWQNNLTIIINPATIEFDAKVFNWHNGEEEDVNVPNQN